MVNELVGRRARSNLVHARQDGLFKRTVVSSCLKPMKRLMLRISDCVFAQPKVCLAFKGKMASHKSVVSL